MGERTVIVHITRLQRFPISAGSGSWGAAPGCYISRLWRFSHESLKRNSDIAKQFSELAKRNPELAKRNPELAKRNPELAKRNPELAKRNSELAKRQCEKPQHFCENRKRFLVLPSGFNLNMEGKAPAMTEQTRRP